MQTRILAVLIGLGCGPAAADDLSHIRALRSLAAEAAEVIRLQAQHRVTDTFAGEMKQEAREQLQGEAKSAEQLQTKQMAWQAMGAVNRGDARRLTEIAQQLLRMEGPHGRAD